MKLTKVNVQQLTCLL